METDVSTTISERSSAYAMHGRPVPMPSTRSMAARMANDPTAERSCPFSKLYITQGRNAHCPAWAGVRQRTAVGSCSHVPLNRAHGSSSRGRRHGHKCWAQATACMADTRKSTTLEFPRHPLRENAWFQEAIREIAKRVSEGKPFMELVELHHRWALFGQETAKLSSIEIGETVLDTPQLWHAIAEELSGRDPDVVVLCKRVDTAVPAAHAHGTPTERKSASQAEVEKACRALVSTGIARAVLTGQVGDCCSAEEQPSSFWGRQNEPTHPSTPSAPIGQRQEVHYWGLVVQSRLRTGVEGCYLLKTVRNIEPCTDCSCIYYSLTRVCQGEGLEQQFLRSWLSN